MKIDLVIRRNRGIIVAVLLLLLACAPGFLFAIDHEVVYTEGYPLVRSSGGRQTDLFIGDSVKTGDTVVTESGDYVELTAEGYTVKVNENTVFSIRELEEDGQKNDVLSCALGKLSFSRDKFLGNEPRLGTSSAICGVRGTNVVLLAGVDGSSLFIVDDGLIEVSASGESVQVAGGEGVEVPTGSAPGEKFKALEREIDFAEWNQGRLETLLEDPVASAQKVKTQMEQFIAEIKKIYPIYLKKKAKLDVERKKARELLDKDKEEGQKYYREKVFPMELDTTYHYLNIRYYALSALSLRRFVSGRMYTILKARNIMTLNDPGYLQFLKIHDRILELFEAEVVENFIVQADI